MRTLVYLSLIDRLKQLAGPDGQPLIQHFDLWNEQVDFAEQEEPWPCPAVFVEFMPVTWATLGGEMQQADLSLRLHIVTQWPGSAADGSIYQDSTLQRFALLEAIDGLLFNLSGGQEGDTCFLMMRPTGAATNHNHEELVEDVNTYTCRVVRKLKTTPAAPSVPPAAG